MKIEIDFVKSKKPHPNPTLGHPEPKNAKSLPSIKNPPVKKVRSLTIAKLLKQVSPTLMSMKFF